MWPTFYIPLAGRRAEAPPEEPGVEYEYSGPVIHPWLGANHDPRNPLNIHEYRIYNGIADTFNSAGRSWENAWDAFYTFHSSGTGSGQNGNPLVEEIIAWSLRDGDNNAEPMAPMDFTEDYECVDLYLWFAPEVPTTFKAQISTSSSSTFTADLTPMDEMIYHSGTVNALRTHGIWFRRSSSSVALPTYVKPSAGPVYAPSAGLTGTQAYVAWNDESFAVRRLPSPPEGDGWVYFSGTAKALSVYSTGRGAPGGYRDQTLIFGGATHNQKRQYCPNGTLRVPSQAEYDDQTWWEARYAEAVAADTMPAGLTYGVEYPVVVDHYYRRVVP